MQLSDIRPARQFGVAVLLVFCAWLANQLLWPLVRPVTFPFFFTAVTIAAWLGGQFSGLVATLLSSVTTTYFFLEPEFDLNLSSGGLLSILIFNGACGLVIHLADLMRAAKARAVEVNESFEAVINSLDEPLSVLDHEWRFLYVNLACAKYLRLQPTEMIGNVVWEMFPTMQGTLFEDHYRRAVRDRVTVTFESFHRSTENWLVVRAVPFSGGLIVSFREIGGDYHHQNSLALSSQGSWRFLLAEPVPVNLPENDLVEILFAKTRLDYAEPLFLPKPAGESPLIRFGDLFPSSQTSNVETIRAFVRSGFRLDNALFIRGDDDLKPHILVYQVVGRIAEGKLHGVTGIRRPPSSLPGEGPRI